MVNLLRVALSTLLLWSFVPALPQDESILRSIVLTDAVIHAKRSGFQFEGLMRQVMSDTTFHQAFINTKYHPHRLTSLLSVHNKDEKEVALLFRKGRLERKGRIAELVLDSVVEIGKLRNRDSSFRYLTAEMYDDVFFSKAPYTASNRISKHQQDIDRSSRFDKYKTELKKFMFDPGQEIGTVPFIGDKMALFDTTMIPFYDYKLDVDLKNGRSCWLFTAMARDSVNGKPADEDDTVIKRMSTWFDQETTQVLAREYRIAHDALFLEFDINITVQNKWLDGTLLPVTIHYDGVWDIPFKKREIVRFDMVMDEWVVVE
ncbi:MAG: hypothetical protein IPG74_06115 [Flavobacteriales bacterium]|nr:hypothetical protein [Flavobacteriales bacterium]